MKVSENKVVSIIYELRKENADGDIVEVLTKHNPLTFLFGRGNLLARFEDNLLGLEEGEKFSFSLKSEDAYGPVEENAIVNISKKAFEIDGIIDEKLLTIGNTIAMMNSNGRKLNGTIIEIFEDKVKMDFNHPMAGVDLYFSGEVTEIRDASENEIMHGHIHSSGGSCSGCGDESGCSGCC